jgi:hypothetical protein
MDSACTLDLQRQVALATCLSKSSSVRIVVSRFLCLIGSVLFAVGRCINRTS